MIDLPAICILFCIIQPPSPTVVSDFCQNTRIFRPSRQDTPDTLRQVATANAKYRALCPKRKP